VSTDNHRGAKAWDDYCAAIGRGVVGLGKLMGRGDFEGMDIKELRIKPPAVEGGDYLVIVKAVVEGRAIVGFHGAGDFGDALRGCYERINNNAMRWREDKPYEAMHEKG